MSREDWARWEAKRMKWESKGRSDEREGRRPAVLEGGVLGLLEDRFNRERVGFKEIEDQLRVIAADRRAISHAEADTAGAISNIIMELERLFSIGGLFKEEGG